MKKQQGFTLIELVVVIVILGILAVTAAPKFMNLQGDARHASLQGLKGAIQGAAGIVYGKAAIEGKEDLGTVTTPENVSKDNIATVYGYPAATEDGIVKALAGVATDGDFVTVTGTGSSGSTNTISFTFNNYEGKEINDVPKGCYVTYQAPSAVNGTPTITLDANACK